MNAVPAIVSGVLIALVPGLSTAEDASSSEPPFVAGRPGNAQTAIAVPKGYLQLESGLASYTSNAQPGVHGQTWTLAQATIRYGLGADTDVELAIFPFTRQVLHIPGADETARGFGNTTLGVLHTFLGADGNGPSFGMMGFVTFPSANKELVEAQIFDDRMTGGALATGSLDLTDKVSLTLTLADDARHPSGSAYLNDVWGAINLTYAFTDKVGSYIEAYGDHTKGSPTQATADLGGTYLLDRVTQLDAGVNIGMNRATPDATFFVGWAHRF
jgi:hypothetical protein